MGMVSVVLSPIPIVVVQYERVLAIPFEEGFELRAPDPATTKVMTAHVVKAAKFTDDVTVIFLLVAPSTMRLIASMTSVVISLTSVTTSILAPRLIRRAALISSLCLLILPFALLVAAFVVVLLIGPLKLLAVGWTRASQIIVYGHIAVDVGEDFRASVVWL